MPDLGTRKLRLEVDGDDFSDAVSTVKITAGDRGSDFISFAEAASGGARDYKLSLVMKQNTDATALWHFMWSQSGAEVPVVIWPNGGTTASTDTPKVTGTVVIAEPDGDYLGGDANVSASARFTTTAEWTFTAKPTLVTS